MHQTMPEGKINRFEILPEYSPKQLVRGNQFIINLSNLDKGSQTTVAWSGLPVSHRERLCLRKALNCPVKGLGSNRTLVFIGR